MNRNGKEQHVAIVGILHILNSVFMIAGAILVFALLTVFGVAEVAEDPTAARALPFMGIIFGGCLTMLALPGLLAGIGLLARRQWAISLAMVVGLFNIFNFPIGTALCFYTLYALRTASPMSPEQRARKRAFFFLRFFS